MLLKEVLSHFLLFFKRSATLHVVHESRCNGSSPLVRCHIGWEERNIFFIRVWKFLTSPFKNLDENSKRESLKKTISGRGELGRLQIVSEPDTG